MKKNLPSLILSLLFIISLSGCNSDNNSSDISYPDADDVPAYAETITEKFQQTTSVSENLVTSDTVSDTELTVSSSDTDISTLSSDTEINSDTENISNSNDIPTSENISENSDVSAQNQPSADMPNEKVIFFSSEFDALNTTDDHDGLKICYNSDEIPAECIMLTADYFKSMQNKDSVAYQSFLIPLYNDYLNEYLAESDYTVDMLLSTYYDTVSAVAGGDFTFSKIEMKRLYEQDYENFNVPDYITSYKSQLDEISEEKDGTYISETFGDCFSVVFNLYAQSQNNEYSVMSSNIISFFEADGKYYIMMA